MRLETAEKLVIALGIEVWNCACLNFNLSKVAKKQELYELAQII